MEFNPQKSQSSQNYIYFVLCKTFNTWVIKQAPRLSKPLMTHHFNHYSTDKTIFSSSEKERVRESQQPSSERCIDHYEDSSVHRALAVELRDHRADPMDLLTAPRTSPWTYYNCVPTTTLSSLVVAMAGDSLQCTVPDSFPSLFLSWRGPMPWCPGYWRPNTTRVSSMSKWAAQLENEPRPHTTTWEH